MNRIITRWYPAFLVAIAFGVSAAVLGRLPDQMVVHWDMAGNPNGWMSRSIGAFFAPFMMLASWAIFRAAPHIDPRRENFQKFAGSYDFIVAAILTLLLVIHLAVLALALGYHVNIGLIAPMLVGILFVVIGNVLPLARPNFMYGIRTPWTLSNDRVWARTHRFGGYSMTIAGLAMIAASILLPSELGVAVVIGASVASLLAPAVYSYLTWKRETKR